MTPSEIYTIIRNQCAESSTEFWSESEMYWLMTIAERIIARRIGIVKVNSAFTSVSDTKTYGLASVICSTVGLISRLTYDSYRLECVEINDFDDIEGMAYGGVELTGQPKYYYRYGDTIGLSPTPDDAKEIEIFFNKIPESITTASTAFSIPSDYADYIPDYVLYRMTMKDQELKGEAEVYKTQWMQNLVEITNEWSSRVRGDSIPCVVINDNILEE